MVLRGVLLLIVFLSSHLVYSQARLAKADPLVFALDYETAAPEFIDAGIFQVVGENCYYLNRVSRSIKVFSFESGETINTIKLENRGPQSVGPQVDVFHVINPDSILVFSQFFKKVVSLINDEGKVLNTYDTWPSEVGGEAYSGEMLSSKTGGIKKIGDEIVLAHCIYDLGVLKTSSVITSVSLKDGSVKVLNELPLMADLIDVDRLAILRGYLSPTIEVVNENRFYVNYPLSSKLFSYSLPDGEVTSYDLASDYFKNIRLRESKSSKGFYDVELRSISFLSGYYYQFLYDPFRKVYYRIMRLPYDEDLYKRYKAGMVEKLTDPIEYSVMVLDTEFNVLLEQAYSGEEYDFPKGAFVAEEGLYVFNKSSSTENAMVFNCLKYNP